MQIQAHEVSLPPSRYLINPILGLSVTGLLFYTVSLSFNVADVNKPKNPQRETQPIKMVPPQPLEPETSDQPNKPVTIETPKFVLMEKRSEIALLDVSVRPKKTTDILKKIETDYSKFVVETSDLDSFRVFRKAEVDRAPEPIHRTMPQVDSKKKKEIVRVMFVVDELGGIGKVYIIESSNPKINESVIRGVKTWKFNPARKSGRDVSCWVRLKIVIRPGGDSMFNI